MANEKKLALNALTQKNFDEFFQAVALIDPYYERYTLANEACSVALQLKDSQLMLQILQIQCDSPYNEYLFSAVLSGLIELGQNALATHCVVLPAVENLTQQKRWIAYINVLLKFESYTQAEKIFQYIQEASEKQRIVRKCLDKLNSSEQLLAWLRWYSYGLSLGELYLYFDMDKLIQYCTEFNDFNSVIEAIVTLPNFAQKSTLLKKLYLKFLTTDNQRAALLEARLPEELAWLIQLREVNNNIERWGVFNQLDLKDAEPFIIKALKKLIDGFSGEQSELTVFCFTAANYTEKHSTFVLSKAAAYCLSSNLIDSAIGLLSHLESYHLDQTLKGLLALPLSAQQLVLVIEKINDCSSYSRNEHYLFLLDHQLTTEQQKVILQQQLDRFFSKPYSTDKKIIEKLPESLVKEENEIRLQLAKQAEKVRLKSEARLARVRKGLQKLKNIHQGSEHYAGLTQRIDRLIKSGQLVQAQGFCEKIVISNYRDYYLMDLLLKAIIKEEEGLISGCLSLFCKKDDNEKILKANVQFQQGNTVSAACCLMSLDHHHVSSVFILLCINKQEDFSAEHLQQLMVSGIFSRHDEELINCVVGKMLSLYPDKEDFLKKAKADKQINGFAEKVLKFLIKKDFDLALCLANVCLDNEGKYYFYCAPFKKALEDKFEQLPLNVSLLRKVALLENESFQQSLIFSVGRRIREIANPKVRIKLLAAIPRAEMRNSRLISYAIELFLGQQLSSAQSAIDKLPDELKNVWREILSLVRKQEFPLLMNLIINKKIKEDTLIHFCAQQWLAVVSLDKVYTKLLEFFQQRSPSEKSRDENNKTCLESEEHKDYQMESTLNQIYQMLIRHLFPNWLETLYAAQGYQRLVEGLERMLESTVSSSMLRLELLNSLRELIRNLSSTEQFECLLSACKHYYRYAADFDFYLFDNVFNRFIDCKQIDLAMELLQFVATTNQQQVWVDKSLFRVGDFYYKNGDYQKVAKAIALCSDTIFDNLRNTVKKWIIKLIGKKKNSDALRILGAMKAPTERDGVEIIESAVKHGNLKVAHRLLSGTIVSPATQICLQKQLQQAYLLQLSSIICDVRTQVLRAAFDKLTQYRDYLKNPSKQDKAQQLQNEMILSLRQILDKSFLTFYEREYRPPLSINGRRLGVYFPVVPELKNKTVEEKLTEYYRSLRIPNFPIEHPELASYILSIQPKADPSYLWLEQLYKLANIEKHAKNSVSLQHELDGVQINMPAFLEETLNGVGQILVKIFDPLISQKNLDSMLFSRYVHYASVENSPALFIASSSAIPRASGVSR